MNLAGICSIAGKPWTPASTTLARNRHCPKTKGGQWHSARAGAGVTNKNQERRGDENKDRMRAARFRSFFVSLRKKFQAVGKYRLNASI